MVSAYRLESMYGDGMAPEKIARFRVNTQTLERWINESEAASRTPSKKTEKPLRLVRPATTTRRYSIDDLSADLRRYVVKRCRQMGISVDEVKVVSPTEVALP